MKRQIGYLAVLVIWGAGLGLALVSYTLWAASCERCSGTPLWLQGLSGYGFLGLVGAAALILIVLKWRRKADIERRRCDCGVVLDKNWNFCPTCGTGRND